MAQDLTHIRSIVREQAQTQGSEFSALTLEERIVGIEESTTGRRLRVTSDGLTLNQKISLEKLLLRACRDAGCEISGVNFAKAGSAGLNPASPQSTKRTSQAFGIQQDKRAIPGVRHVVVVASGKGGVGKSTVSANLAVALEMRGLRVGLMDCDVYGPSAPILLGLGGEMEVGPDGKLIPLVGHKIKTVSFGFLSDVRSPIIWRGPLVSKAIEQFCYDVAWGDLDVLIVDMPPGTGDVQLTIAEKLPVHAAIVVTTPQDVALIDAHKAVSMFERLEVPIAGVVENMAWFECRNCGHAEHIFGSDAFQTFSESRGLKVLTRIPLSGDIRIASDSGRPPALAPEKPQSKSYHELGQAVAEYLQLV